MIEFLLLVLLVYFIVKTFKAYYKPYERDDTEIWVEKELDRLLAQDGYVIFGDLIIPSISKSIPSTQIDHVIVSIYGIFCLETKSHQGSIYGSRRRKYWKQYLGPNRYELYNPLWQNRHHVQSLEYLLRSRLKSPIHSYVVFPSAQRVKVDNQEVDLTLRSTVDKILNHKRQVYTIDDVSAMAKGLAYASDKSLAFRDQHIQVVREYIASQD